MAEPILVITAVEVVAVISGAHVGIVDDRVALEVSLVGTNGFHGTGLGEVAGVIGGDNVRRG